ncbi:MAG: hypothetical protein WC942_03810 [Clostridia bacterium]|jgi:hypothetical protein
MHLTNKQVEMLAQAIHEKMEERIKKFNSICDTAPFNRNDTYFVDYELAKKLDEEIQQKTKARDEIRKKYVNKEINGYTFPKQSWNIFTAKTKTTYTGKLRGKKDIPSIKTIEKELVLCSLENSENIVKKVINKFIQ